MSTVTFDVEVDSGDSVKTLGTMRDELEAINEELEQVEVGSKAFQELSKQSAKVSSEIKDIEKSFEGLDATQRTEAFAKGFEGIAGAVAVTAGTLSLFGVESERIGEIEQKVQASIAIAVGARSVAEGALNARIAARVVQEKAAIVATKAAAIAQKAFNLVLNANPLGLIILTVTALIAIFTKFGDKIKLFIKASLGPLATMAEKVGKFLRKIGSAIGIVASSEEIAAEKSKKLSEQRVKQQERELKLAQARGEETIQLERNLLNEKMKLYETDSDEYKNLVNDKAVLEANYNKKLSDAATERAKKRKEEREKELEEQKKANELRLAEEKKAAEESVKIEQDRVNGIAGVLEGFRTKEQDIQAETELQKIALEQERALAELDRLKATEEQKAEVIEFFARRTQEVITATEQEEGKKRVLATQQERDMKIAAQVQFASAAAGIFTQLGGLLKEGTAASKAAALADLAINTGIGFIQGLDIAQKSAKATGPGAAFAFPIFYATQIAAVLSAVNKAKGVFAKVPGGGSGPDASGPSTGGTPSGGFGGATTAIGQLAEGSVLTPTAPDNQLVGRTYVLAGDVTSEQEAQAKLNNRRTL